MSGITDYWIEQYKRQRGVGYLGFKKHDAIILHQLCNDYGEQTVRTIIKRFLAIEDEPMLRRSGWDTKSLALRARGLYVDVVKQYGEVAVNEANAKREAMKAAPGQVLSLLDRIGKGMG